MSKKVAVIMGSDSDWPVVKAACTQLKTFGIPFEAHMLRLRRLPSLPAATGLARSSVPLVWLRIWPVHLLPTLLFPLSAFP